MLSVLIPVYNKDITLLAMTLVGQAYELKVPYEILIIDDGSEECYHELNSMSAKLRGVVYERLEQNVGRSRIRNLLADKAQYDYLLFLDCDVKIERTDFLKKYCDVCKDNAVVCGGIVYEKTPPADKEYYLHWFYGSQREAIPAVQRNQQPNKAFKTANFLIAKSVFQNIRFDERIRYYGHEDTLFGLQLEKSGYKTFHIDNPAVHLGLEHHDIFLKKLNLSLQNLLYIYKNSGKDKDLSNNIRVLKTFCKANKIGLCSLLSGIAEKFGERIERKLKGENPSLTLLDFYKLCQLCKINRKEKIL